MRAVALSLLLICTLSPALADETASDEPTGPWQDLSYRLIGPAAGGRVSRVAGVPGDPLTYWAATAAGGVWKSTNGGQDWKSVFDKQPVSSIGSIAIAPSDPNVVWVGSGEANVRGNVGEGNGIYRSTDGGKNWTHVWKAEGQIGTMIVHPSDPDTAFAAVLGSPFGPGVERGVLRTTDGGKTWKKVLFVDADTGASDICFDPGNPRILFAGTWQVRRKPWNLTSGGPGSGLWISRDGGDTWKRLEGEGLPEGTWGRVGVGVARTNASRVYALIEAEEGGLFASADGGDTWNRVSASRGLRQRAWYYSTLTIDPKEPDVVWFPQVNLLKTVDGGASVRSVKGGGWDYHDVWIDPVDTKRILIGSDAGVSFSRDGGETWVRAAMPISQLYHLAVDTRDPYRVMASLQDLGTLSGPSRSLRAEKILLSDWHGVGGGEAGHVVPDPTDPDLVYAGEYLGFISRWNGRTLRAPHVGIYPDNGSGHGARDLRYRFQWTAPIVLSPHDPKTVYHAANVLFRTRDGGQSWASMSPDLTRNDRDKQGWSGGPITGDNTSVEHYGTIFAVGESPVTRGLIWAGSDDGLVHVTRDDGANWKNVTPRDFPAWATVRTIEPSRFDAGTAWLVADAHRLDDETPYLWGTTDYGSSWTRMGRDLDAEVYLHVVREDPKRRGLLYLGTERGVMFSRDAGKSWESLRLDMPTVAVVDLAIAGDDLVVGTLGRSIFILDDLTPVRESTPALAGARAHLFAPRPATLRTSPSRWNSPQGSREGAGANPPNGAAFTYHLAEKPKGPFTVEVLDGNGRVVRTLTSELKPQYTLRDHPDWNPDADPKPELSAKPGFNRAAWDLRYEEAEWIEGARNDIGGRGPGPWALPGDYTLRLTLGGTSVTQPLRLTPDPASTARPEDRAAQFAFLLEQRDRMTRIAQMGQTLRTVREQLDSREALLTGKGAAAELTARSHRFVEALSAVESALYNPQAEVDYDVLGGRQGGAKLYERLGWLVTGATSHEGPPTQGMREVAATIAGELAAQEAAFARLMGPDLAELNAAAAALDLGFVIAP
jgi:photosystem II stability/assembly factor-like uncharacterized protein